MSCHSHGYTLVTHEHSRMPDDHVHVRADLFAAPERTHNLKPKGRVSFGESRSYSRMKLFNFGTWDHDLHLVVIQQGQLGVKNYPCSSSRSGTDPLRIGYFASILLVCRFQEVIECPRSGLHADRQRPLRTAGQSTSSLSFRLDPPEPVHATQFDHCHFLGRETLELGRKAHFEQLAN